MQDLVAWTAHNGDFRVAIMSFRIVVTRARGGSAFLRVDEGAQTEVILLMLVDIAGNGVLIRARMLDSARPLVSLDPADGPVLRRVLLRRETVDRLVRSRSRHIRDYLGVDKFGLYRKQ